MTNLEEFREAIKELHAEGLDSPEDMKVFLMTSIAALLAKIADSLNSRDDCDHCCYKIAAEDEW